MTKFFDFEGEAIPMRRDSSSEFYAEVDGLLTRIVMLLADGAWVVEGVIFTMNILGERQTYRVERIEYEIDLHQRRGKYGQLRRRVLVVNTSNDTALATLGADALSRAS